MINSQQHTSTGQINNLLTEGLDSASSGGIRNYLDSSEGLDSLRDGRVSSAGIRNRPDSSCSISSTMYLANVMSTTDIHLGSKPRRPSTRALLELDNDDEGRTPTAGDDTGSPDAGDISDIESHEGVTNTGAVWCISEEEHTDSDCFVETMSVRSNSPQPPVEDTPENPPMETIYATDADLTVDASCLKCATPPLPAFYNILDNCDNTSPSSKDNLQFNDKSQYYDEKCSIPGSRPGSSPRHGPSFGWRPVMPGYKDTGGGHHRSFFFKSTLEVDTYDGSLRDAIPSMPKALAVICLLFNIFLPGTGL